MESGRTFFHIDCKFHIRRVERVDEFDQNDSRNKQFVQEGREYKV